MRLKIWRINFNLLQQEKECITNLSSKGHFFIYSWKKMFSLLKTHFAKTMHTTLLPGMMWLSIKEAVKILTIMLPFKFLPKSILLLKFLDKKCREKQHRMRKLEVILNRKWRHKHLSWPQKLTATFLPWEKKYTSFIVCLRMDYAFLVHGTTYRDLSDKSWLKIYNIY